MTKRNEFVDYLLELLRPTGAVSSRAMFGGHGIYRDGIIFGIVADDVFYLKVDDTNREEFEARGLGPFVYEPPRGGAPMTMSYYLCPEDALESAAAMREWADSGFAAALRAAARKPAKSSKPSKATTSTSPRPKAQGGKLKP